MSQSKNEGESGPTTFVSLPREIRDQIFGYIAIADKGFVTVSRCPTDYGNCNGLEAIRKILHASTSTTTHFAREAYEVYFHQNIFRLLSENLPEFVNRKCHYLKNKGYFDVNAWIGCLEVILHKSIRDSVGYGMLVNELRQLLECPRLHTVNIRIECCNLKELQLSEMLQTIAEVCAQLREKMGNRFKVETDGEEKWGNGKKQPLSPWTSKSKKRSIDFVDSGQMGHMGELDTAA